jgi:hypothetical protein
MVSNAHSNDSSALNGVWKPMILPRQPLIVLSFCKQHDDGNATISEEIVFSQCTRVVVVQHSLCSRASRERETRGFIAAYSGCGAANTPCAIPQIAARLAPMLVNVQMSVVDTYRVHVPRHLL